MQLPPFPLGVLLLLLLGRLAQTREVPPEQTTAEKTTAEKTTAEKASAEGDPCRFCCKAHRGVLHRATDPQNLDRGCLVYTRLEDGKLELLRGKDPVKSFKVSSIQTPLLFVPESEMCFVVRGAEGSEVLCAENLTGRDEWWKAITRSVLCSHSGTPMRHEISGEPYEEELTEMVEDGAVQDPEKQGGIEIKLTGFSDLPALHTA